MTGKRILALLLSLLALAAFGCRKASNSVEPVLDNAVWDGAGRVLALPSEPEQTTVASVYAVSVPFLKALGVTQRVVAINVKSRFWTQTDAHLAAAGTIGRGVVDLEALAKVSPGVLIHRSNDPETVEAVERMGVPVVCITVEDLDDIKETMRLLGKYLGASARAEAVCAYLDEKFAKIGGIVSAIPPEERVTALMMGGELGRIAGGDMLQSWMIEKAGGICVASEVENERSWTNIGVETIFSWDPEAIFCTSSTALEYTIDGLYQDGAWSAVRAVKDGRVYAMPAAIDSWDMPGVNCALGTFYLLYRLYPAYFSAEQMQEEIDAHYGFFFGETFTSDYLGYALEE